MSQQLELIPENGNSPNQKETVRLFTLYQKIAVLIAALLLAVSIIYDEEILLWTSHLRFYPLDDVMLFITNKGFAVLLTALAVTVLYRRKIPEIALIVVSTMASLGLGYILKKIFQMPRPYTFEHLSGIAIASSYGWSFPSLHAAVCFSIIPFLKDILRKKWLYVLVTGLLFLVVVSRTYLGVHYLDDIIAGALIGYIVAKVCLYLQHKYQLVQLCLHHIKDKLELRRQIAHMVTGTVFLLLIKFSLINVQILAVLLAVGGILCLVVIRIKVPLIHEVLHFFDREKDKDNFPAKGAFFFVLGVTISLMLFEQNIAMAAIAIMTYGDAVTTLAGTYFGRIKNPLNPDKHLEGTAAAIILSTIVAFAFVRFPQALLGSVAGMFVESLTVRFIDKPLDDNVIIPIIAGITMTAIGY